MASPSRAKWRSFWLGTIGTSELEGLFPTMHEVRTSQTAVFDRRLTIGPADQDSDDFISTLSMGDWSGGGQIEEMTGADQSRYWWGILDARSPRQAALPPLVTADKPVGASGTAYPLGVVNQTAYFAFGTDIAGYNQATSTWYTAESMSHAPVGKCCSFQGRLFIPCGTNGYKIITESATGNPSVSSITGADAPTSNDPVPTSNPKPVHFCVFEGHKLFALTTTGHIAYSFTGDNNDWVWDYHDPTDKFPALESGCTPYRLIPFYNRSGVPALFASHSRGIHLYNRNVPQWEETPIQYPKHPDVGKAAAVWRPGEDLWVGTGLDTVRYTSSNVAIPLSGVSRDAGVPGNYRGAIVDLEPELSCLYALIGGVNETYTALAYDDKLGSTGTGNGQFDDPLGVAVNPSTGDVWVVDSSNHRVQILDEASLTYGSQFGSSGDGDGEFNTPAGVDFDASGNGFVVDSNNGRVQKFTSTGTFDSEFGVEDDGTPESAGSSTWTLLNTYGSTGSGDDNFDTPGQVAVDSTGNTYIADTGNDRLVKRDSGGTFVDEITGLTGITGVAVDSSGNVYAAMPARTAKYNSSLVSQWDISGWGFSLRHAATDGTHVYMTADDQRVYKFLCSTGAGVTSWTHADLDDPVGITTDGTHVFVATETTECIVKFTTSGSHVATLEPFKSLITAVLAGITHDGSGRLLVTDQGTDRVWRLNGTTGSVVDFFAYTNPHGVARHSDGTVWVTSDTADTLDEYELVVVDPIPAAPPINGGFNAPHGIAINRDTGRIYVADTGNHRVQYFTSAGVYEGQFGNTDFDSATGAIEVSALPGEFDTPTDIAVNQNTGTVYVVDEGNRRVQYFDEDGVYLGSFGGAGTDDGKFTVPRGIAIRLRTNNVFVGDQSQDRIQEFSATGAFRRFYGSAGSGDGQFSAIAGIAFSADDEHLYVTDSGADRIQEFLDTDVTDSLISKPNLQAWTGVGWVGMWEGTEGVIPTWAEVMSTPGGYRLWWGADDGNAYFMKLRRTMHNPRQGVLIGSIDDFAPTGYLETSNADMGMLGFQKIASHVLVFMRFATGDENLVVEYEIDDGGWNTLGTVTQAGRTALPLNVQTLSTGEEVSVGLPFNWIRFRLTMNRGSNSKLSPIIRAFNLHFLKVPQNSSSFEFTVPLPKRSWNGRGPREMSDALNELLESDEMLLLRHQDRLYRGRLAQVTGIDATGRDFSGTRQISFIELPDGTG